MSSKSFIDTLLEEGSLVSLTPQFIGYIGNWAASCQARFVSKHRLKDKLKIARKNVKQLNKDLCIEKLENIKLQGELMAHGGEFIATTGDDLQSLHGVDSEISQYDTPEKIDFSNKKRVSSKKKGIAKKNRRKLTPKLKYSKAKK